MANQHMKDSWKRIQRRIRNTWEDVEFSDKELKSCRKDFRGMVSLIQEKSGESRQRVIRKMDAVMGIMHNRPYKRLKTSRA